MKKMLVGVATTAVGIAVGLWTYNRFLKMKPTSSSTPAAAAMAMQQSPLQGV